MYSQVLSDPENEQSALQASGYGTAGNAPPSQPAQQARPMQQSASAVQSSGQQATRPASDSSAAMDAPEQQQRGANVWSQLGQMASSMSSGPSDNQGTMESAPGMRPSVFASGPAQSDAPQVRVPPPRMGKAQKIMQIVQAVMTYGASKAGQQEPNDNQGFKQTGPSNNGFGAASAPASTGSSGAVGTGMGDWKSYGAPASSGGNGGGDMMPYGGSGSGGGMPSGEDWKEYG